MSTPNRSSRDIFHRLFPPDGYASVALGPDEAVHRLTFEDCASDVLYEEGREDDWPVDSDV